MNAYRRAMQLDEEEHTPGEEAETQGTLRKRIISLVGATLERIQKIKERREERLGQRAKAR